jgi:YtcA-like protein
VKAWASAERIRVLRLVAVGVAPVPTAGCDPVVNVQGSFVPAWILCMAVGIAVTALVRQLFAVIQLESHLGPLLLIYPSLWLLVTLMTWLVFYRT